MGLRLGGRTERERDSEIGAEVQPFQELGLITHGSF